MLPESPDTIFENSEARNAINISVSSLSKNLTVAQLRFYLGKSDSIEAAQAEINQEIKEKKDEEARNKAICPRYRAKIAQSLRKKEAGAYRYQKVNRYRRARYVLRMRLLAKYLERCGISAHHFTKKYAKEYYYFLNIAIKRIWGRDVAPATHARISKHYKATYFFNIQKSYSQNRQFLLYSYSHNFTTTRALVNNFSNPLKKDNEKTPLALKNTKNATFLIYQKNITRKKSKIDKKRSACWAFVRRDKNFSNKECEKIYIACKYIMQRKPRVQNYWVKFNLCAGLFRQAIKKAWENGITKEKFIVALNNTMETYCINTKELFLKLFENMNLKLKTQ